MPLEALRLLSVVWTDRNLPYLPKPNTVDVVLSPDIAPLYLTPTAFVVPFLADGRAVFSRNRRRGIEIPGGHIESGEDALAAAIRESLEETGCEITDIVPIGFLRMEALGPRPPGYSYPYPLGFQQFFAATVTRMRRYQANDECLEPVLLRPSEVRSSIGPCRESHRIFHAEAYRRLFLAADTPQPPSS